MKMKKFDIDKLMVIIGEFGWYQKLIFLLLGLPTIAFAFQILGWVFIGANLTHRCWLPIDNENSSAGYDLPDYQREKYIPKNANGDWSQCFYYDDNHTEVKCTRYVYQHTFFQTSVVETWDLVCDRSYLSATTVALFMIGLLIGSFVFGKFSDKFGRKMSLFIGITIEGVFGLGSALTHSLPTFMAFRFLCGFAGPGLFLVNYCLCFEFVGRSKRLVVSMIAMMFFTFGYFVVTFLAYFITNWRTLMLVVTCFNILLLPLWWIIPESPRWLLSVSNVDEAEKVFMKIAKYNKKRLPDDWFNIVSCKTNEEIPGLGVHLTAEEDVERPTLMSLFRYSELRCRTLNVCFNWFVCSGVYYGLSLNTSNLGGNPFLNAFVSAAVEIPAILLIMFLLDRTGRKIPVLISLVLSGLALMITIAVPSDLNWLIVTLSMIGKFNITIAYDTIYLYTAEMYPTSVRNVAVGLGSFSGRIGDVASPFINLLGTIWSPLPQLVFGVLSCTAGLLTYFFPETLRTTLPETIKDTKDLGKFNTAYGE